tara:strand:+ start:382 stop:588 length:207 start_codon:yes stop_codon:yes gene_type:complete
MKKILLILLCLPMIGFGQVTSPSIIGSSSASYSSGGNIDYTLGGIFVETYTNSTTILSQGFHQGDLKT